MDGGANRSAVYRWIIALLPVLTVFMSALACSISYGIGVKVGTIQPFPYLPFISDMGDKPPQSSVFTLGLSISCYFTLMVVIIRYNQVKNVYNHGWKMNDASLYFGVVFVLGKLIIASFQLSSNKFVHYLGAVLYFVGTMGYAMSQLYITHANTTKISRYIYYLRLLSCITMLFSAIIFAIFFGVPTLKVYNRHGQNVAQGAEWTFAVFKMVFMLTFLYDFWNVDLCFYVKFKERHPQSDLTLVEVDDEP